jgi:PAS domain S-box-containing protein
MVADAFLPQSKKSHSVVTNGKDRVRVLHVDDDPSILEVSKSILELEGNFEVDDASSVDEALKRLVGQAYDLVVSDYEMPNKNGLDFLRTLREQKNMIPFALFTGKGREDVAMTALNLGADGYYNKQGSTETVYGELAHGLRSVIERYKAKSALEESEKRYHTLMQKAAEAIFIHDKNGKILDVNQKACQNLQYTREELLSMNIKDISPVAEKNPQMDQLWSRVISGESTSFESAEKRKDQSTFPIEVALNAIEFDKEKLVIATVRDITERRQAETIIKRAYEEWQRTFDAIGDIAYVVSRDFRLVKVNKSFCQFIEKAPEEIIGKRCFEVFHKTDKPVPNCPHVETLSTGKAVTQEVNDSTHGKSFSINNSPIFDDKGELTGALHIAKDITELKKTEAIKESEEMIRRVFNYLPDLLFFKDKDLKYIATNRALEQFLGLKQGESIGKSDLELMPKEAAQGCFETDLKALQSGFVSAEETVGGKVYSTVKQRVTDETGNTIGVAGSIRDVTERVKAEENLRNLKAFDERIINSLSGALLIIDPNDYKIINVNEAAQKQMKLEKEDIIGKTCYEMTHHRSTPCHPPNDTCPIQEVLETGKSITVEHIHLDENNNQRTVEVWAHPVKNPEGKKVVIHIARDVTERKKAEENLKISERRLTKAQAVAHIGDWDWSIQTDKLTWGEQTYRLFGFPLETVPSVEKFLDRVHPDDAAFVRQSIENALKGKPYDIDMRIIRTDGVERVANATGEVEYDPQGKPMRMYGMIQDITERKKAEEALNRVMDELVLVNEKLGVVGSLTRHDVRNKLSAVTGYAYLLKKKHADEADIVEGLGKMEQAVKDSIKIFEFAKVYEQLGAEKLTYLEVEKTVKEAVAILSGFNLRVVNECEGLVVLADSFLRQLFYNLMDNTRKYGQKATKVRVYSEKVESDGLKLVYEDDGVGISAENKLRLFSEGFSTGGSTGFGLFLIKKMMDVYGWQIQEVGEPGKGAKFTITIPKLNKNGKENFQTSSSRNAYTT